MTLYQLASLDSAFADLVGERREEASINQRLLEAANLSDRL